MASLRQAIKDELAVTSEHDIMKYSKSIKRTLAPVWLRQTDAVIYLCPPAAQCPPGMTPASKSERKRVTDLISKHWNKFLQVCFRKVSYSRSAVRSCTFYNFYLMFIYSFQNTT